jgi:hypothetical protein
MQILKNYLSRDIFYIGSITLSIYLFFGVLFQYDSVTNSYIFLLNLTLLSTYLYILIKFTQIQNFSLRMALLITFAYNLFFVCVINIAFYLYGGSFFAFSAVDSLEYHEIASNMAVSLHSDPSQFTPENWEIDDYGFVKYVSVLYYFINSPLVVNFINIFLNLITMYFMYEIGRVFLDRQHTIFAVLLYGISGYSIFYQSSGLKEILMITLILGSYFFYYKYYLNKRLFYLFLSLIFAGSMFFFRVPLFYFIIISIVLSKIVSMGLVRNIIRLKLNFKAIIFIITALLSIRYIHSIDANFILKYFSDIILIPKTAAESFPGKGYLFIYINSILASFFGPLPTFTAYEGNLNISIYSGSIMLRVLLGFYFFYGIFKKNNIIMPIILFCLMEMFFLTLTLNSFELRKNLPHYPFLVLILTYGIQCIHLKNKSIFSLKMYKLYLTLMAFVIILWNTLRML